MFSVPKRGLLTKTSHCTKITAGRMLRQYQVQHQYVDHSTDCCTSETLTQVDMEHIDKLHFPGMLSRAVAPALLIILHLRCLYCNLKSLFSHHFSPVLAKLYVILDHVKEDGLDDVVSWQPHGRAFRVHNHAIFLSRIMPRYFHQSKLASFQRQLNIYGFQRITKGIDKGSYYHHLMLRDKPFLAHQITRVSVKGTGVRPRSNPEQEPNFYAMPPINNASLAPIQVKDEVKQSSRSPSPAVTDHVAPYNKTYSTSSGVQDSEDMDILNDQVIIFEGQKFHYLDPYKMHGARVTAKADSAACSLQ